LRSLRSRRYIVLELAPRGSLRAVMDKSGDKLKMSLKLSFIDGAAQGMCYLHSRTPPVLHQDLKPDNLLVMDDWSVKVTDFGLSESDITLASSTMSQIAGANGGTLAYMAPELHDEKPFTEKCDVFR
jgi:serine/threonine protein kinase